MSYPIHKLQGIFYAKIKGDWLYYVRADVDGPDDAKKKTLELAARLRTPACVYIEDWNFPKGPSNAYRFSTEDK
jgi:hypothetical protein